MQNYLELTDAHFIKSAEKPSQCPPDEGAEIAFCGRSNAGKSSALNYLTRNKKLARTSKTPGRTQLLNFFGAGEDIRLVDLPGYGFARVPEKVKAAWHRHIDEYLRARESLVGLVIVMDVRHPLKEFDMMMIEWGQAAGVPVHIVLTKADKLGSGARKSTLLKVQRVLPEGVTAQLLSATHDIGRDEFARVLEAWVASTMPPA